MLEIAGNLNLSSTDSLLSRTAINPHQQDNKMQLKVLENLIKGLWAKIIKYAAHL